MNTNWMIFLAGLVIGILGAGYIVYEIEQTKYLSLENNYQDAVTKAQAKVLAETISGNKINATIGAEYEKSTNDAINKWRASWLPKSTGASSLPVIPKDTSATTKTACDSSGFAKKISAYQTAEALCKIQLNEIEKWQNQICKVYPCQ